MWIDKNIKKISFAYGIQIILLIIISLFNPLGMYKVSGYTYLLIIICTTSFLIAFNIISRYMIKTKEDFNNAQNKMLISLDKLLKSKIFLFLTFIMFFIVTYYLIKYNIIIKDMPKLQIRMVRFIDLFGSSIETLFFNYIIAGYVYIASIIFSVMLINKRYKNPIFILISFTILEFSLIGYSRMVYFNIAIYIFINILLKSNLKELINLKNIIKISAIFGIVFVMLFGMIYARICKNNVSVVNNIKKTIKNQSEQIIEYSVGSFRLLDYFIKNGFEGLKHKYTYGQATFAGIEEIILYPIKGIGVEINSFNNIMGKQTQIPIKIGEDTEFNAFYTCVMNFYLDYGFLGVIIFPILHSILIILSLNQYYRKKNIFSFILLNFVLLNLFFSIIRWNYQSGTSTFVLLTMIFITNFENIKNKIQEKILQK